ncbi:hypothetical protein N0V93_000205 [Gnomoniopsis smithogilvyi]|uniref:Distal membrane-arm assembly complex protein 1-like domain-containing protein n=1 Tax=Gnomoniopsis smithogilvyi TaxID=1191159 RepID=A0A9W9D160_9PEZI|nr:hypothetical protein N0V93_000205 [Gnomoniopsis smithogilvyi]
MAGDTPSLTSLDKPVKANDIIRQEQREYDCMPCRVVGATAFIGLAGYSYWEGMRQLEVNRAKIIKSKSMIGMRPRKVGLAGISLGLFWMGIYRLFG